jgi:CO/xanthine dehydrogenase FAD-binding subunit
MIGEYYRPDSVEKAVELLSAKGGNLRPLGGGTHLSRFQTDLQGVVDLQSTGLEKIKVAGQQIMVGATTCLDALMETPNLDAEIKRAIRLDVSKNIRNMATLGGWLVTSDARSAFSTVLLALDVTLTWEPNHVQVRMGDWLPIREMESPGVLLTEVEWDLRPNLVFEYVARSPKDRPTLIVAVTQWGSGRTRVALGGFGPAPIIALDGPEGTGADVACRDAYFEAEDAWASAAYRREVAPKLVVRCLERIDAMKGSEA